MSKYKVDIFEALKKINEGKYEWFESFTEEEQNSLAPFVLLLWIKGAQRNHMAHIIMTNEYVNSFVFSLDPEHRQLLYKLFCFSNNFNDGSYYKFRKKDKDYLSLKAICWYYQTNKKKSQEIFQLLNQEELEEIKEEYEQSKET